MTSTSTSTSTSISTPQPTRFRQAVVGAVAGFLLLAACGSSDGDTSTEPLDEVTTTTEDPSDPEQTTTETSADATGSMELECTSGSTGSSCTSTPDDGLVMAFVAAEPIPAGTEIDAYSPQDQVESGEVRRTERPDDAVVTLEQIVGLTALEDIDAGEVLTTSMFG